MIVSTKQSSNGIAWPTFLAIYGAILGAYIIAFWLTIRKRRWSDWAWLGKAQRMPPEHREIKERELRDLEVGETAWIDRWSISTTKRGKTYIRWDARLRQEPTVQGYDPSFLVERLKYGFSLTIRPGVVFITRSVIWGHYAPVVEIIQEPDDKQHYAGAKQENSAE